MNSGRYGRRRFQEPNTGGGGQNTFIGYNAGEYSTKSHNTAIGFSCGVGLGDGENNVYLGDGAGYHTYDYNTGVSGSNNVYLGQDAGGTYFNGGNTGSNNVYVGQNAGGGTTASGSGNVFIGREAGRDESGSNLLYIDNSWTTNPLIYGNFATNLLRINGTLTINEDGNDFAFPNSRGTSGNVLISNGTGTTSWSSTANLDDDWTVSGNDMYSAPTGLVGIGTTVPNAKLHVNAGASEDGLRVQIGGSSKLTVKNNGGTSIGAYHESPPVNGLYVQGAVQMNTSMQVNSGTTIKKIQAGSYNAGTGTGGVKTVTINFPTTFATTPNINVTVKGQNYGDVFAVTTRNVGTSSFQVNIYRVDSAGGLWGQTLYLDWYAWEQ